VNELPAIKPLHYHGQHWAPLGLNLRGDVCRFTPLPGYQTMARVVAWMGYAAFGLSVLVLVSTFDLAMTAFVAFIAGLFVLASRWGASQQAISPSFDLRNGTALVPDGFMKRSLREVSLRDIEAIQYAPFRKHGTEPLKVIHGEINVVLRSGERLNLCHHNDLSRMRADAQRLAEFLQRPLHVHRPWSI